MSTEQTYVKAMTDLVAMYIVPLMAHARGDDKIISEKAIGRLFSNAQLITVFNQVHVSVIELNACRCLNSYLMTNSLMCRVLFFVLSLFLCCNDIVMQQKLLMDIEAKVNTWDNDTTKLSDVFITLGPFFKMYTQVSQ